MDTERSIRRIIKELLGEIRNLLSPLGKIETHAEAIAKNTKPEQKGSETAQVLRAELQIPEAVINKRNTADDRKEKHERWMLIVQAAGVIVVAFYTTVTYWMY